MGKAKEIDFMFSSPGPKNPKAARKADKKASARHTKMLSRSPSASAPHVKALSKLHKKSAKKG